MNSMNYKKKCGLWKVCAIVLIFAILVGVAYEIFQYNITTTKPAKSQEIFATDEYGLTTLSSSNPSSLDNFEFIESNIGGTPGDYSGSYEVNGNTFYTVTDDNFLTEDSVELSMTVNNISDEVSGLISLGEKDSSGRIAVLLDVSSLIGGESSSDGRIDDALFEENVSGKEGSTLSDVGSIRFTNVVTIDGEELDAVINFDSVRLYNSFTTEYLNSYTESTAGLKDGKIEIAHISGTKLSIGTNPAAAGSESENEVRYSSDYYQYPCNQDTDLTIKIVKTGTDEVVDDSFMQLARDIDMYHHDSSIVGYVAETLKTVSGFTGNYYFFKENLNNIYSSSKGVVTIQASEETQNCEGTVNGGTTGDNEVHIAGVCMDTYTGEWQVSYSTGYMATGVILYVTPYTNIIGEKIWDDNDNQDGVRPESITVHLYANDEEIDSRIVTEEDNWNFEFTYVDKYDDDDVKIVYTIDEDEVRDYEITYDGYNIINTHTPETTNINGEKIWDDNDNQDGIRPESVTVHLLADGEEVDSKDVTEEDDWKYTFENVPVYNNGVKINYTITEDTVDSYSVTYDGYNITNKYTPDKTSLTVVKIWDDEDDQDGIRPTVIEVELLKNGEATGNLLDLNETNNWEGSFTELDKYEDGEEISYTVQEIEVDGYETQISGNMETGFIIKNVHEVEVVEPEILDETESPDDDEPDDTEVIQEVVVQDVYKSGGYKSEIIYTGTAEYVSAILIAVGLVIIIIAAVFMVNRKNKVFVVLIIIGIILAVVGILLAYNTNKENSDFEEYNEEILTEMEDSIDSYENEIIEDEEENSEDDDSEETKKNIEDSELTEGNESEVISGSSSSAVSSTYVTTLKINDYNYMGILTIPALDNLSLPVLNDCTDDNLKKSICRYDGTAQNNDLIIAGHRYKSSFGKLQDLNIGDVAYFKDVDGNTYKYKLVSTEILKSSQGEELESGDWDMTLFTCDYTSTRREVYRFEIE